MCVGVGLLRGGDLISDLILFLFPSHPSTIIHTNFIAYLFGLYNEIFSWLFCRSVPKFVKVQVLAYNIYYLGSI